MLNRYAKVVVPEMNLGQLALLLRGKYLVDVQSVTKVEGMAFLADEVEEYARTILPPDRPFVEALVALYAQIYRDFTYAKGTTSVRTTLPELLAQREGVCQDFAHIALACLRSHGVAARYVSGYLATRPAPGKERVFGADASHAWLAVWLPPVGEGGADGGSRGAEGSGAGGSGACGAGGG